MKRFTVLVDVKLLVAVDAETDADAMDKVHFWAEGVRYNEEGDSIIEENSQGSAVNRFVDDAELPAGMEAELFISSIGAVEVINNHAEAALMVAKHVEDQATDPVLMAPLRREAKKSLVA